MAVTSFDLQKVKRAIAWRGTPYLFYSYGLNDIGEPTDEVVLIGAVKGIFHQTTSHVTVVATESSKIKSKPAPMILATYEDAKLLNSKCWVTIGTNTYDVLDILDIDAKGLIANVSLEVRV